jgi:hypothetical protein
MVASYDITSLVRDESGRLSLDMEKGWKGQNNS